MSKKINEVDKLKALLVIVTGLVVLGILSKGKPGWFYAAGSVGVLSLAIPAIGDGILWLWFKIAEVLGWINSRILLSLIFFVFLYPISWLMKISSKNMMFLKRVKNNSVYAERNHKYKKEDLENIW